MAWAVGLVALMAIGGVAVRAIRALVETSDLVAHTHEVLSNLASAHADIVTAEAARRGYAITGREWHLDRYEAARTAVGSRLDHIARLIADHPGQLARLGGLRSSVATRLKSLDDAIALRRAFPDATDRQAAMTDHGEALMRDVERAIDDMAREEGVLLGRREREARTSARKATLVLLLGTALAVAALAGSGLVAGRQMRARERAENAVRASETMYRTVADNFPNGMLLLFDRDLRYQMAGGSGLQPAPELLVGRTPRETLPAEMCDQIEPLYRDALEGRAGTAQVFYGGRHHLIQVVPVRDERGQVTSGIVMSQDVTERSPTRRWPA
jgi:CHASE3 domain sensor protein